MSEDEQELSIPVGSIHIEVEACGHGTMSVFVSIDGLGELETLGALEKAKNELLNAEVFETLFGTGEGEER